MWVWLELASFGRPSEMPPLREALATAISVGRLPPRQPREDGTGPALRLGRAGLPPALLAGGGPPCDGTVLPADPNGDGPCRATARAVRGQPRMRRNHL